VSKHLVLSRLKQSEVEIIGIVFETVEVELTGIIFGNLLGIMELHMVLRPQL
jgi:hypothetical protein